MFRRLAGLFRQYRAAHLRAARPGPALRGPDGAALGHVDEIALDGPRLTVRGRTQAASVTLSSGAARAETRVGEDGRFALAVPRALERHPAPAHLTLDGHMVPLPLPRAPDWRLVPGFALRLARAAPHVLAWQRSRDPAARTAIRRALGFLVTRLARIEAAALPPRPDTPLPSAPITIVLPVYNAFELLGEVLTRVERHTDLPWHLVVIEDVSTDARVRPFLTDWAAARPGTVTLIAPEANLGFIGAVNLGLEAARQREGHVVLLNSDALVPEGWAARLMAPILADAAVASVTPLSNDAEIFTIPVICARMALAPGEADAIDAAARALDPVRATAPAPTGVGFCMGLNRAFLDRLPRLDPAFGRGYGEEVDWCQKVRAMGGIHLGTAALFVEHRGGASFGSAAKQALVAANNRLVSTRHPGYDAEVQSFIATDPLRTARLALALDWAAARGATLGRPVPIYVAHSLGGGAEADLARRLAADISEGAAAVLRLGGPARWQVEVHTPSGVTTGATDDAALVSRLVAALPDRRLVYSCAVDDPDPLGLPPVLLDLAGDGPVEILFHDYFPLNPAYTLLDPQGRYPGTDAAARELRAPLRDPSGTPVTLARWQAAWGPLLSRAGRLTVFSQDSAAHVAAARPDLADRIAVAPHDLPTAVPAIPRPRASGRTIAVLGSINAQKGLRVLTPLAHALPKGDRVVVLGKVDRSLPLSRRVAVHGGYQVEDLPALVAAYGITHWLIPSIWPETFSFTTHEALATGLPVMAFDIGAQGAAVAAAANGVAVPYAETPHAQAAAILAALGPAR